MATNATDNNVQTTDVLTSVMARNIAQKWNDARLAKAQLEKEIEQYEDQLRAYVQETGEMELGVAKAYTRSNPAKLEVKGGTALSKLELAIIDKVDADYVTKKLNVSFIAEQWASDGDLRTVLTSFGVQPVAGETKVYFKPA